uniref:Uncharacterized protein n=1 Tax=Arundo donax TaxID=35708 RepID=A0A0A9GGJ3_ARUDO
MCISPTVPDHRGRVLADHPWPPSSTRARSSLCHRSVRTLPRATHWPVYVISSPPLLRRRREHGVAIEAPQCGALLSLSGKATGTPRFVHSIRLILHWS